MGIYKSTNDYIVIMNVVIIQSEVRFYKVGKSSITVEKSIVTGFQLILLSRVKIIQGIDGIFSF